MSKGFEIESKKVDDDPDVVSYDLSFVVNRDEED